MTLLQLRGVSHVYPLRVGAWRTQRGSLKALADVDLTIAPGESVALVGESGSGKTTLGRIALGLLEPTGGEVLLAGRRVREHGRVGREVRRRLQLVPQDPYASLHPLHAVERIIGGPIVLHGLVDAAGRRAAAERWTDRVGLPAALLDRRPHALSAGQRQRVAIARAMAVEPEVVVLDEPLSALDASVRAQVANLLNALRHAGGASFLFITHDLAMAPHVADRLVVLFQGAIVETLPAASLGAARHPYTQALIAAAEGRAPPLADR